MKARPMFTVLSCTALALFAAHWLRAQVTNQAKPHEPINAYHNLALDQLTAFVSHLEATKQTNALKLFNDYSYSSHAQQHAADLGMITAVLLQLRDGHTNEAITLLESRLDGDAVGLWASYNELPPTMREKVSLKSLEYARGYCAK